LLPSGLGANKGMKTQLLQQSEYDLENDIVKFKLKILNFKFVALQRTTQPHCALSTNFPFPFRELKGKKWEICRNATPT
jgi:hypothetical protein